MKYDIYWLLRPLDTLPYVAFSAASFAVCDTSYAGQHGSCEAVFIVSVDRLFRVPLNIKIDRTLDALLHRLRLEVTYVPCSSCLVRRKGHHLPAPALQTEGSVEQRFIECSKYDQQRNLSQSSEQFRYTPFVQKVLGPGSRPKKQRLAN